MSAVKIPSMGSIESVSTLLALAVVAYLGYRLYTAGAGITSTVTNSLQAVGKAVGAAVDTTANVVGIGKDGTTNNVPTVTDAGTVAGQQKMIDDAAASDAGSLGVIAETGAYQQVPQPPMSDAMGNIGGGGVGYY